eukprot:30838-Pelagococcus_subviridis.AAC.12
MALSADACSRLPSPPADDDANDASAIARPLGDARVEPGREPGREPGPLPPSAKSGRRNAFGGGRSRGTRAPRDGDGSDDDDGSAVGEKNSAGLPGADGSRPSSVSSSVSSSSRRNESVGSSGPASPRPVTDLVVETIESSNAELVRVGEFASDVAVETPPRSGSIAVPTRSAVTRSRTPSTRLFLNTKSRVVHGEDRSSETPGRRIHSSHVPKCDDANTSLRRAFLVAWSIFPPDARLRNPQNSPPGRRTISRCVVGACSPTDDAKSSRARERHCSNRYRAPPPPASSAYAFAAYGTSSSWPRSATTSPCDRLGFGSEFKITCAVRRPWTTSSPSILAVG